MSSPRFLHFAVLLADGRVLAAGGCSAAGGAPNFVGYPVACTSQEQSAEIYDPSSGKWQATAPMSVPRAQFQAVLIPAEPKESCGELCGHVLVVGGSRQDTGAAAADTFDPGTGRWQEIPSPEKVISGNLVAVHGTSKTCGTVCGKILLIGRDMAARGDHVEVFDPVKKSWETLADSPVFLGYSGVVTTVLPNGEILVTGALAERPKADPSVSGGRAVPTEPAIYNPARNQWRELDVDSVVSRNNHSATALETGEVLIAGGAQVGGYAATAAVELLDPVGGKIKPARSLRTARLNHVAVPLKGLGVLVMSGRPVMPELGAHGELPQASEIPAPPEAEVYESKTRAWRPAVGKSIYHGAYSRNWGPVFTA
ncbi:MAG: Kelch repeat-containing protein, partial [Actinomycetota bacterium]